MRAITMVAGAAAAVFASAALAGGGLAPFVDRGWYNNAGSHTPTNQNYITGKSGTTIYNSFYVFDLSSFSGNAVSATLTLPQPASGFQGTDAVLTMWSYEGSIASLIAGTGGVAAHNDLMDGTNLGSLLIGVGTNGFNVVLNFNAAGLAYLTSKFGGQVAIGAALSYDPNQATHRSFGFTSSTQVTSLNIDTEIPAPGALALLGLAGVTARRRRRA